MTKPEPDQRERGRMGHMTYPEPRFTVLTHASVAHELTFFPESLGPGVRSEVTESGELRVYQNSGAAIDLSGVFSPLGSGPLGAAFGGPEQPVLSVMKYGAHVWLPDPDATYVSVKLTRYQRARRRIRNTVADWRLGLGERVAGVKLTEGDDW